nr:bifunctional riboflavin kinase/FAD synthetase [Roseomonas acroporae]
MQTSVGQTSAGQTSAGQTSAGQTSAGQTSAGQTSAGQTSAGQAPAGAATAQATIARDWHAVPRALRGATVALGNFDGVHVGHRAVLRAAHAARPDLPLAALTFEPHPREHFRPEDPPFRLTLLPAKAEALAGAGAGIVYALPFDDDLAALSAETFVEEVLHRGLGVRHLACGADFAFGHRRGGDADFLAAAAEARGIGLTVVPPVVDAAGPISSTRIRRLLQDGYPERAAAELGRPWEVRGHVAHGDKRGRLLGFPTANLPLGRHLEPARGVYAVSAVLPGGGMALGVANIGRRPTVDGTESRVEAHLFDFAGDLYGREIAVRLHRFLRPERKFPGLEALRAQIALDAAAARAALA